MDKLQEYLKDTNYTLCDATYLSIHEIQDRLRECRTDQDLIVFVEKLDDSNGFFERLRFFKLDNQNSNYYIAH